MKWNEHYASRGLHATLSASTNHWVNYTPEKLKQVYINNQKKLEGTELHDLASKLIKKKVKVANHKKAFNLFVNDAIGLRMESEQILRYSEHAFGTADAISFRDNHLQIHDLKTGTNSVSFTQLDIYAAFFCLEYDVAPESITIESRIYQGSDFRVHVPEATDIRYLMDRIVAFDIIIADTIEELSQM